MSDFISNFAAIMRAEVDMLDTIAQNNANVNTAGYRSERSALNGSNFIDALRGNHENLSISKLNHQNGSLKVTQNTFDFALMGQGWFGVQNTDGSVSLTRNGNFSIDNEGKLVTSTGLAVLGTSGEITGLDASISVHGDGSIVIGGEVVDQLAVYTSSDDAKVQSLGNGLYKVDAELTEAENYKIVQGALESSNVDTAADMVRLMETTRHIESLQRAMSSYDELLNIGINQIGK